MNLTLKEISKMINGVLEGDEQKIILYVKPLEIADEKSICYIENSEKIKLLSPKAGCVIAPLKEKEKIKLETNIIWVENPKLAFAILLQYESEEQKKKYPPYISPNAIISNSATIGKNCYINHFTIIEDGAIIEDDVVIEANCYIGKNTRIGKNTYIYPQVVIRENISIGKNCIIHSNTTIGSDGYGYIQDKGIHFKIPQIGSVKIEDNVEIGAGCCIDRATLGETTIGEGTKIDNLVHIAHNVKIGKNCLILAQAGIAGSTEIGNNVIIAGQAGIADHIVIEDNSIIMAKTGVIGRVKKNSILFGFIGRDRKEYLKIEAILSKLPEIYNFFKKMKNEKENN